VDTTTVKPTLDKKKKNLERNRSLNNARKKLDQAQSTPAHQRGETDPTDKEGEE